MVKRERQREELRCTDCVPVKDIEDHNNPSVALPSNREVTVGDLINEHRSLQRKDTRNAAGSPHSPSAELCCCWLPALKVFTKSLPANETEGSYPGSGKRESENCSPARQSALESNLVCV